MIKYSQYKSSNKILNFDLSTFMPVKQRFEMISGLIQDPKIISSYYKNWRELILVNRGANYGTELLSDNSKMYYWPYLFGEDEYIAKGIYEENGDFKIDHNLFLVLCYLSGLGMIELSEICGGTVDNEQKGLVITSTSKKTVISHAEVIENAVTAFHLYEEVTV